MKMTLEKYSKIDLSQWHGSDQLSRNDMKAVDEMIRAEFEEYGVQAGINISEGKLTLIIGLPLGNSAGDLVWFNCPLADLVTQAIADEMPDEDIASAIKALAGRL